MEDEATIHQWQATVDEESETYVEALHQHILLQVTCALSVKPYEAGMHYFPNKRSSLIPK